MIDMIGICGEKQVGKSTVASMLQYILTSDLPVFGEWKSTWDNYPTGRIPNSEWTIKAYADKLKEIAAILAGCKVEEFESEDFKNSYIPRYLDQIFPHSPKRHTFRELLQYLGTDVFRNLSSDIWITLTLKDYKPGDKWIISDVRRKNEANMIRVPYTPSVLIKVNRLPTGAVIVDQHISEREVDLLNPDIVIDNNGTQEELFIKLINLVKDNFKL